MLLNLTSSLLGLAIFLCLAAIWVWALWDCLKREFRDPNHKLLWLAGIVVPVLIGLGPLGAFAYLLFGRPQGYRRG